MARPPKNHIHDPFYQMKDFFIDESMKRVIPKNPYNILWFIEHAFENAPELNALKSECLKAIQENKSLDKKIIPFQVQNKLIDDELVIKRVKELKGQYNVDIDKVAVKVIRMSSHYLVKGLLEMGMNPNYIDEHGLTPLISSITRHKTKIIEEYFNDPRTDRYTMDKDGNNIAFLCVMYRNWKILEKVIIAEPELLLSTNKDGETIFDKLAGINSGKGLFINEGSDSSLITVPKRMKKVFIEMVKYLFYQKIEIPRNHSGKEINEIIINANYLKLRESLSCEVISDKKEKKLKI